MRGRHDYNATCMCYRCKGVRNSPSFVAVRRRRAVKEKVATRDEQHARYIDCGPGAWDDRD